MTGHRFVSMAMAWIFFSAPLAVCGQEVSDPTRTKVAVMKHPKTGKPYVAILPEGETPKDALIFPSGSAAEEAGKVSRPDYRMLDWKVKNGEIPYSGPTSDRTKVYVLAATLATVGVVSGTAVALSVPAATAATTATTASGAGAGVYAAAGTAIAAGAVSTAMVQSRPDPNKDDFDHTSESKKISIDEALSQTKKG